MLRHFITVSLDRARYLVSVQLDHGREAFRRELERYLDTLLDGTLQDPAEADRRLMALLSGLLSAVFARDVEKVIRAQLGLSRTFFTLRGVPEKREAFVAAATDFLAGFCPFAGDGGQTSDRADLYLRLCPDEVIRDLSVASWAERFGYTADHFSRKYRQERGSTPGEALQREKLARARAMIEAGDGLSLKAIAFRLGFSDYGHFRKVYKEHFGHPPSGAENHPSAAIP
ncbi:MAG: helix-turn-helix transcriptional regulator [Acidobacteria bacterium]|nr:helix-turn-helix transcriptional regulator [Acidobacteriota bacterium]